MRRFSVVLTLPIFVASLFLSGTAAYAQDFVGPNPQALMGKTRLGAGFAQSSIDYKVGGYTYEVERSLLGISVERDLSPKFNLGGFFAYAVESEASRVGTIEGDGFQLGVNLRSILYQKGPWQAGANAKLVRTEDTWDENGSSSGSTKMSVTELGGEGFVLSEVAKDIHLGATGSLLFYSKGDLKVSRSGVSANGKVKRDDKFVIRFFADIVSGAYSFRPELTLIGEESWFMGGTYTF